MFDLCKPVRMEVFDRKKLNTREFFSISLSEFIPVKKMFRYENQANTAPRGAIKESVSKKLSALLQNAYFHTAFASSDCNI